MSSERVDKAYAVLGLGKSGQSAVKTLHRMGYTPYVADMDESKVSHAVESCFCLPYAGQIVDYAVTSPAITPSRARAMCRAEQYISEIQLGYSFLRSHYRDMPYIIAVTGTNGKTTVVTMLQHVLSSVGMRCVSCGNIGSPLCDVVSELPDFSVIVLEISSFQLLYTHDFHADIGIITSLASNHLDWHTDMREYYAAKRKLFDFCDTSISGSGSVFNDFECEKAQPFSCLGGDEIDCENAGIATSALRAMGVPVMDIIRGLVSYNPPKMRRQLIREFGGKRYVNDSKSTSIAATHAAVKAMGLSVALIVGGHDKGLDFTELFHGEVLPTYVFVVGECADVICTAATQTGYTAFVKCDSLEEAVHRATATDAECVLFSPAASSFDCYTDYVQRGKHFEAIVSALH